MTVRAHIHGFEGACAPDFTLSGAVTFSSTGARRGSYGMICDATSAAATAQYGITATSYYHIGRFYFRVPTLPASDMTICRWNTSTGYTMKYRASDGKLILEGYIGGALQETVTGPPLHPNTWTRIDYKALGGSFTEEIDWLIDGKSYGDITPNVSYATVQNVYFGHTSALANAIVHIDDWVHINNTASGENATMATFYPVGPGYVKRLAVTNSGAHNGPEYFSASSGTVQNSWSLLNELPADSISTWVQQGIVSTTAYVEYEFDELTTPLSSSDKVSGINVRPYGTSSGLNANSFILRIIDNSPQDYGYYDSGSWTGEGWKNDSARVYGVPVSGTQHWSITTPWSQSRVNSLKARAGYSDDVNGIPRLASLYLEVSILQSEDYLNFVQGQPAIPWIKV